MGLSSSQARLLTLTARQHSIEYQAQRLEAQKLQLANDSDQVYQDYLKRLDACKIQYRDVQADGSMYYCDATFTDLAKKDFLFNVDGVICDNFESVKETLKAKGIVDLTASDSYTLLTTLIQEGYVVLMEISDTQDSSYSYRRDGEKGAIYYTDPTTGIETKKCDVTANTEEGIDYVFKVFKNTSVSTSTNIQEISDEKELRKAEAQYEADMNRINAKDSKYDTELSQFETERNAIKQEIDTLKTVANDNVERTFKLFT